MKFLLSDSTDIARLTSSCSALLSSGDAVCLATPHPDIHNGVGHALGWPAGFRTRLISLPAPLSETQLIIDEGATLKGGRYLKE